jgi:hypothetical protein
VRYAAGSASYGVPLIASFMAICSSIKVPPHFEGDTMLELLMGGLYKARR